MRRLVFFILISFSLFGCGKMESGGADGSGPGISGEKSVLSTWVDIEDSSNVLDLAGATFNAPIAMTFDFGSGRKCTCAFSIFGSELNGSYSMNGCNSTGSIAEPNCIQLNQMGSYTKANGQLTVCRTPQSCTVFY